MTYGLPPVVSCNDLLLNKRAVILSLLTNSYFEAKQHTIVINVTICRYATDIIKPWPLASCDGCINNKYGLYSSRTTLIETRDVCKTLTSRPFSMKHLPRYIFTLPSTRWNKKFWINTFNSPSTRWNKKFWINTFTSPTRCYGKNIEWQSISNQQF